MSKKVSPLFTLKTEPFGNSSGRRAALARPRLIIAAMSSLLTVSVLLALAQRQGLVQEPFQKATRVAKNKHKPLTWANLPRMVAEYGQQRAAAALAGLKSQDKNSITPRLFPLTEVDLTKGNTADEREPIYRPQGDYIVFASNGVLNTTTNKLGGVNADGSDGKPRYHIWIMRRDGTGLVQVTGLRSDDKALDQSSPSWAPNGTTVVYVNGNPPVNYTGAAQTRQPTQLFTVQPFSPTPQNTIQQLTFFSGEKRSPAWSPTGSAIAFASDVAPGPNNTSISLGQFDIFTISPSGSTTTVRRLTGDADGAAGSTPTATDPQDVLGNTTDDLNPAYSVVNPGVIFFSSNRAAGQRLGTGRRIYAMDSLTGANKRQVTDPTARGGVASDSDDRPSPSPADASIGFAEHLAFQSNSKIDSSDTTFDLNVWSLPIDTSSSNAFLTVTTPVETSTNTATEESNRASSPNGAAASNLPATDEDKVADMEPTFSRSTASLQLVSQIVFASQRPKAAMAGAPVINPGGPSTSDLWSTALQDFTPPLLVPISVGNQIFPFLAPGPQYPGSTPRTAEQGLTPGGKVVVGFVIEEKESGLSNVSITFKDADRPQFFRRTELVNGTIPVDIAIELQPQAVTNALKMQVFDDGPPSKGGHELQANAAKGDGLYYCQGSFPTLDSAGNPLNGDYYIDATVSDKDGNGLTYDNVYGFSTRPFNKSNPVLFVSDYTVGQQFPLNLTVGVRADASVMPVESYYLSNPGGTILRGAPAPSPGPSPSPSPSPSPGPTPTPTPGPIFPGDEDPPYNGPADTRTFSRADVWRVLARGEVPDEIINLYAPSVTEQVDPNVPNATSGDQFDKTRKVAVAETAIVWASPYTGDLFVGPGTLYDANTQTRLTNFLNKGGRLFVTGNDVVFALSNAGNVSNLFLEKELLAQWNDEEFPTLHFNTLTGSSDPFIVGRTPLDIAINDNVITRPIADPPATLHTPYNNLDANNPHQSTFADAAFNQQFAVSGIIGNQIISGLPTGDKIKQVAAGANQTLTTLYSYSDGIAAQRIETTGRGDLGLESRVVFFSFGLEGVHREYQLRNSVPECRNFRSKIADNIIAYMETGRIVGQVVNSETNLPVKDFLIQVTIRGGAGNQRLFMVRTDANGNYEIAGVPAGQNYQVDCAYFTDANGVRRSLNGPYYTNLGWGPVTVRSAQTAGPLNFRVNPIPPVSIRGRAISDKGTPTVTTDDTDPSVIPAPNLPVLLVSKSDSLPSTDRYPGGGTYAALVTTDAGGNFVFPNVPTNVDYRIIFNPKPGLVSQGGDIPDGSGINYGQSASPIKPSPDFGRRVIPDDNWKGLNPIFPTPAQAGSTIDLGNVPIPPHQISGRVTLNGQPLQGATVQLLQNSAVVRTTTTAADGTYAFLGVNAGTYTVKATSGTLTKTSAAFTVQTGQNFTVPDINLVGGTTTPTPTASPSPTPVVRNGKIAFASNRTGNQQIYTMNPDGTLQTRITTNTAADYQPAFSPNGSRIAFVSNRDGNANIFVMNADGSSQLRLTTSPADDVQPMFSPDGTRLIFTSYRDGSAQIYIMNANGTGQARLTNSSVTGGGSYPAFNPAGTLIVFTAQRDIWTMNTDGTNPVNLTKNSSFNYWGRFSPNGTRIVYTSYFSGSYDVFIMNADGSGQTRLAGNSASFDAQPSFSPDGSRIVFTTQRNGNNDIYTMATNGSSLLRLTTSAAGDSDPNWGSVIAVTPTPSPSPTAQPTVVAYQAGQTYQISIPFMDSTDPLATTTPAKSFSVPMVSGTTTNYRLTHYNPLTGAYDALSAGSLLHRGDGYFLFPNVNMGLNAASPTHVPTGASQFTVTLRRNSSLPASNTSNGYNLVGFPFDPKIYRTVNWHACKVTMPNGTVYSTVDQAAAAGVMVNTLQTLQDSSSSTYITTGTMVPYKGYWAKTYVDGIKVTMFASTAPP